MPLPGRSNPLRRTALDVTLYVCGITPYDTTHLGHAFTYTVFDVLVRVLEHQGHRVRYVQNVTDIDDDILRKAGETGEDWQALGNRWTSHFIEDMQRLNVRPPDFYPRATDVISDIVAIVEGLLAAGVAYSAGGNVYFHIDAWPPLASLAICLAPKCCPLLTSGATSLMIPTSAIHWILCYGRRRSLASRPGRVRGDRGDQGGTSNALRCPRNSSARLWTSMAVGVTSSSPTTNVR